MQPVARDPLDELATMLERATPIPLTDQVRFDRTKALALIDEASSTGSGQTGTAFEELRALVMNAPPVPLTRQHRVPKDEARRLIAEARAGI